MAYGSRYRYDSESHDGLLHRLEVVQLGYSGGVDELPVTTKSWCRPTFEGRPIWISDLAVQLDDDGAISTLINAGGEDAFRLRYSVNAGSGYTQKWEGKIIPALDRWSADRFNTDAYTLQAADGLGGLRGVTFEEAVGGTAAVARVPVTQVIVKLLDYVGLDIPVRIACERYPYVDGGPQLTSEPLDAVRMWELNYGSWVPEQYREVLRMLDLQMAGETTESPSAYKVLWDICYVFGLRLYQWNGTWRLIEERLLQGGAFTSYEYSSGYSGGGGTPQAESAHLVIDGFLPRGAGAAFESIEPIRQATLVHPIRSTPLVNGTMDGTVGADLPTGYVKSGVWTTAVVGEARVTGTALLMGTADNTWGDIGSLPALGFLGTSRKLTFTTGNIKALPGLGIRVQWCHKGEGIPKSKRDYHFFIAFESMGDYLQQDGSWLETTDPVEQYLTSRVSGAWECTVPLWSQDIPSDGPLVVHILIPWQYHKDGPSPPTDLVLLDDLSVDLTMNGRVVSEGIITTATLTSLQAGQRLDAVTLPLGDVPSVNMYSGLFVPSSGGETPTHSWRIGPYGGAPATGVSLHQFVLADHLNRSAPGSRKKRIFDGSARVVPGAVARIEPHHAPVIDGVVFSPDTLSFDIHSADSTFYAREAAWEALVPDYSLVDVEGGTASPGGSVTPGSVQEGASGGNLLTEIENRADQDPLTRLSAAVGTDGVKTTLPVDQLLAGSEVVRLFEDDPFYVIHPVTGFKIECECDADFTEDDTEITIVGQEFDAELPIGSAIYLPLALAMRNALKGGGVLGRVRSNVEINKGDNTNLYIDLVGGDTGSLDVVLRFYAQAAKLLKWQLGMGAGSAAANDFALVSGGATSRLLFQIAGDNQYHALAAKKHHFLVGGASAVEIAEDATVLHNETIKDASGNTRLRVTDNDITEINVPATKTIQLKVNDTTILEIKGGEITAAQHIKRAADPVADDDLARKAYVDAGDHAEMTAIGDSGYTAPAISSPPTQSEVQAVADALEQLAGKVDTLLANLRTTGRQAL